MNTKSALALFATAALAFAAAAKTSTPAGFTDDLDAALADAKASGKLVYACFSGSDWCGWCKRLEAEVLSKPEFVSAVADDFALVYIDSPSDKSLLSPKARKANPALVEKYEIPGFPTALIIDAEGKTTAQTGYRPGGPAAYASHLKSLKKNAPEIKRLKDQISALEAQLRDLEK